MVRKLTFADIAGYLPYGLKVQDEDQDIWTIRQLGNVDPCRDGDVGLVSDDGHYEQYTYIDDIELVLRPMSDLYKEITDKDYNDGKPFVPLVELAKAKFPCFDNYDFNAAGMFVSCSMEDGSCSEWYKYDEDKLSIEEFDLLHRLKFDFRGLIDADLAVSVHHLKQNPYDKWKQFEHTGMVSFFVEGYWT